MLTSLKCGILVFWNTNKTPSIPHISQNSPISFIVEFNACELVPFELWTSHWTTNRVWSGLRETYGFYESIFLSVRQRTRCSLYALSVFWCSAVWHFNGPVLFRIHQCFKYACLALIGTDLIPHSCRWTAIKCVMQFWRTTIHEIWT